MKKRILILCCFLHGIFPLKASALLGADFNVIGSVSTGYDDNVTLVKDNKKSDNITNLLIGLGLKQEGKTYQFNVEGNVTEHLFANNSSFNNNSQDINVNFQKELSKYDRFSVTNKFTHAEDPQNFEDDFGRASGRYSYYRNTFNTEYTRDLSKYISIQGHYGNETYSTSQENSRDTLLHQIGLDTIFIQNSSTTFLAGYDFAARHIDDSGTATVHTWTTGVKHFLTSQLFFNARAGVSLVEAFNGKTASKPSIVVALTNDFNERDSASLSYSKTSTPSSYSADIFDSWRISAALSRQLLERLKMTMSIFFGHGDFEALNITDKQTGTSSRLSYEISDNTAAFLAYTYSSIDSNIDNRSYNRNLVEVGMRVAF